MERGQAVQLNSYAGSRQRRRHSCSRVVGVQGSGDGGGQFNGWKHMAALHAKAIIGIVFISLAQRLSVPVHLRALHIC